MGDARCLDPDPHVFFPEGQGASNEPAKRVCRTCDVRAECLAKAAREEIGLSGNDRWAVFGGLSPWQRARISPLAADT